MRFNIRERFDNFLKNSKDYPLLAGFVLGFYPFVFYYSNNFDLVNSWQQTAFFFYYFIISAIIAVFTVFKILQKSKYSEYASMGVFITMLLSLPVYLMGSFFFYCSFKRIGLCLTLTGLLIWLFTKFKIKNYKYFIVIIMLMSVLPVFKIGEIIYHNYANSLQWQVQPDNILKTSFKKTPNVYFIQPDGYASDFNLKGSLYQFDNSEFDNWLKDRKFTLYNDYKSNYVSTLFSNSSCFCMKHHYYNEFSRFKYARDFIVGENAVLKIFKTNNYKTFFITERPYFLVSRPEVYYDYSNFKSDELPYERDGWFSFKEISKEIKNQIVGNEKSNNFFFIEKFNPAHIAPQKLPGGTVESERIDYIRRLKIGNHWLKEMVSYIETKDPNAIIIIGADHGGFVGFECMAQSMDKITDPKLIQSMFGAKLAIKWNNPNHAEYDTQLKSPVNLFRILFSYLSEDRSLLKNLQPNTSYNCYDPGDYTKVYKVLDKNGSSAFLKSKI